VHGIKVSECWGDGVYVNGQSTHSGMMPSSYMTVRSVTSTDNRHQSMSITPADHIYVLDSSFTNTSGTLPEAGIDLEPMDMGNTEYVRIENTVLSGNEGNGLEVHDHVSHVSVVSSTIESNVGFGIYAGSPFSSAVRGSTIELNGLAGVHLARTTHDIKILDNTIRINSTHYISPTHKGGGLARDFSMSSTTYNITLSGNQFTN